MVYITGCPVLPISKNGNVGTTNGSLIGSVATFTCYANFVLVGDAIIACLENKTWNGTYPICKQKGIYVFSI